MKHAVPHVRLIAALILAATAWLALAALPGAPAHAQESGAAAQGTIVLAQNNQGPGGFFRRLFGNNRQAPPQRRYEGPLEIVPGFDLRPREAPQQRRERRVRRSEPAPAPVQAVQKAPDAKRALVVGDFFGAALAKGLAEAYRENPDVVVIDATSGSSGLVRDDYYDWPGKLPELVAEQKPDAILVVIGGNDRQAIRTEAGSQALQSDGWRAAYAARVAAFADALKTTGKPVLWVGLVPVAANAMSRDYSAFNGIVREQLEAKGLPFVDTWNGFADEDGQYVASGPDISGQPAQLRAGDGLSFTKAGQRKLAFFVEQTLTDIFGGTAPQVVAAVAPAGAEAVSIPGETAPAIGPMVPLDALGLAGGDALSAGGGRGGLADAIATDLASSAPKPTPGARVDAFPWPADGLAVEPTTGVGMRR